jgi:hypothetical protein
MTDWTRDEVLAALLLYTQLSFGQMYQLNPDLRALADTWAARLARWP